jgi:hypothetical protein
MRKLLIGLILGLSAPLLLAALPRLLPVREGGTGVREVASDGILVGRGASATLVATVIPACAQLGWNATTHAFVCNATSTTTTSSTSTSSSTSSSTTTSTSTSTTTTT